MSVITTALLPVFTQALEQLIPIATGVLLVQATIFGVRRIYYAARYGSAPPTRESLSRDYYKRNEERNYARKQSAERNYKKGSVQL